MSKRGAGTEMDRILQFRGSGTKSPVFCDVGVRGQKSKQVSVREFKLACICVWRTLDN